MSDSAASHAKKKMDGIYSIQWINIFHLETEGQRRQYKPNLLNNSGLFSHLTQVIQMTSSTMLEMEDKKYQISQKIATVSTHATKKKKK